MNLLHACEINKNEVKLDNRQKGDLKSIVQLRKLFSESQKLGVGDAAFQKEIDAKIYDNCDKSRKEYWKKYKRLTKEYRNQQYLNGDLPDHLTILNTLDKVKLSEYRKLADKFSMVITPIEYTEVEKLFQFHETPEKMVKALNFFKFLLEEDDSSNYDLYLVCPVDYYNVWEQIKSEKDSPIYYPEQLEDKFEMLEMLIPTQKNLYLASKINEKNIQNLAGTMEKNIGVLNTGIQKISNKMDKFELDQLEKGRLVAEELQALNKKVTDIQLDIKEDKRIEAELKAKEIESNKLRVQELEKSKARILELEKDKIRQSKLEKLNLAEVAEWRTFYMKYDPILFAVEKEADIIMGDDTSIVGLCWGVDIDERTFDLKNITVQNSELTSEKVNNKLFDTMDVMPKEEGESKEKRDKIKKLIVACGDDINDQLIEEYSYNANYLIEFISKEMIPGNSRSFLSARCGEKCSVIDIKFPLSKQSFKIDRKNYILKNNLNEFVDALSDVTINKLLN